MATRKTKTKSETVSNTTNVEASRSASVHPIPTQGMNELTIESKNQRRTQSQPARASYRRRPLKSAVPESARLSPIQRPTEKGKIGRPITIYTNHFPVKIDDAIINQYEVEIAMIGRDNKPRRARKDERWETLRRIQERVKNFPLVWYDENSNLYTKELLTEYTVPLEVSFKVEEETKKFRLTIKNLVRQEKVRDILAFVNGTTSKRPHDVIRIIETLFKQHIRNTYFNFRQQYFKRTQTLLDLEDGRGLASGFYQALCLTQAGLTLNFTLAFTCFYMPLNLVDFSKSYLRTDITKKFTKAEQDGFRKLVRSLLIQTKHTGKQRRYRIRHFGLPANELTFSLGKDENSVSEGVPESENNNEENDSSKEIIKVDEYFAKKYGKLKYPHLPCIDAVRGEEPRAHWLPMEMTEVVEWQRSLRPLDSVQRAKVGKESIIPPSERYDRIMRIVNERDFKHDPYLQSLNIQVDTQEMMKINARILPSPEIKYRGRDNREVIEEVSLGTWKIRNRFYRTQEIHKWGMICFSTQRPDTTVINILKQFEEELPNTLKHCGIFVRTKPSCASKPARPEEIEKTMKDASQNGWQLTVVILNETSDDVYADVKRWGNQKLGLITQCVSFQALQRNANNLRMYLDNLSQKINAKMGGINGVANLKAALSRPSNEDLFMFFGADVTHTTCSPDRPSVAAVAGSCDPTGSRYAARISEQYHERGRCSVEIIKDFDTMVVELLKVFANSCGNRLPNKIVFYRDGVDDGQFQKVLDYEIMKFKDACRAIYGKKQQPQLTYIIVKKRHNTRFFSYDGQKTTNIPAGTVVDQTVVHPTQFDFYLCSQSPGMGTSRPSLYHVLYDEIGFSSDEIQQLTYWMCHTDARCSKAVSIPAPVHYAHLAAYASHLYDFQDNRDLQSDEYEDNLENVSLEDIETKLMILDPKVADGMWFV